VADFKLSSPNLRVLRGSLDAPEVIEVQTLNPDLIAYDRTRLRQKPVWPAAQDNPWQWLTFLAWHACRREGRIPADLTYEAWEGSTLQVENVTDDEDEDADGVGVTDPTPPGAVPG
jgi:hypothetical protein